jgi:hypothetical protein
MTRLITQPEPQALTFVRKTIKIAVTEVDGFMLQNGLFYQGLRSTGRAINRNHQRVAFVVSQLSAAGVDALRGSESQGFAQASAAGNADPVVRLSNRPETLLSLSLAYRVWSYEARYAVRDAAKVSAEPRKAAQLMAQAEASQEAAWQLIDTLAGVSLERSYQEAFGVQDSRNQEDRLLDYFITLNIGKYRKLFDDQFQLEFRRVTGHDINSPSRHVKFIIANFFWNRLPASVYEAIMDLNPVGDDGRRHYKHHQLLSDNAKLEVALPIVSALKAFMAQAPANCVRYVNEQMDLIHPAQRGPRAKTSQARHLQRSFC